MNATANRVRLGILGASGYTGAELLRLLAKHPGVSIDAAGGRGDDAVESKGLVAQVALDPAADQIHAVEVVGCGILVHEFNEQRLHRVLFGAKAFDDRGFGGRRSHADPRRRSWGRSGAIPSILGPHRAA